MLLGFLAALVACSAPSTAPAPAARDTTTDRVGIGELLSDVTEAWGLDFVHFNGMSGEMYMPEMMGSGVALLDFDADGDLDVYLVQGNLLGPEMTLADSLIPTHHSSLTGRLFRNDTVGSPDQPHPRFVDVSESSGQLGTGYGMGAAVADYDNDGFVDLYLTNLGANQLLRNRGDGTFVDVTNVADVGDSHWSVSASFFDYDNDGALDLFVTNYVDFDTTSLKGCFATTGQRDYCAPSAYPPLPNLLYRNRGDGTFEDVSKSSGIAASRASSLGVVALDADGDGWSDLFVANDQMPNELWLNRGDGTFRDEAALSGCAVNLDGKPEASMGIAIADLGDDGREDLFLTHLTEESNTLYRGDGAGVFSDRTSESGLDSASRPYTGFGTGFLDVDGDGILDLFVANGAIRRLERFAREGDPFPLRQPNQLFLGDADLHFTAISTSNFQTETSDWRTSRGVAIGDLDGDGNEDIVIANNSGPARILSGSSAANWLTLRTSYRPVIRSSGLEFFAGESQTHRRRRRPRTDGSYASARSPDVTFKIGHESSLQRVEVHNGNGVARVFTELAPNRLYVLPPQETSHGK